MNIIRDEEMAGLAMIPLFVDWHIRRCNVDGCTEKPTTIITGAGDNVAAFGLCEKHYQAANQGETQHYDLVWDNFDAFAAASPRRADDGVRLPTSCNGEDE